MLNLALSLLAQGFEIILIPTFLGESLSLLCLKVVENPLGLWRNNPTVKIFCWQVILYQSRLNLSLTQLLRFYVFLQSRITNYLDTNQSPTWFRQQSYNLDRTPEVPRLADVGIIMFDIALSIRAKNRLDSLSKADVGVYIIYSHNRRKRYYTPVPPPYDLTDTLFQVCFDDIFNISKIPTLSAISIDNRLFMIQKLLDELGNNRSICAVRILPSAKHIEIAHSIGVQTVQFVIQLAAFLIHTLGQRIRREQITLLPLFFGRKGWSS